MSKKIKKKQKKNFKLNNKRKLIIGLMALVVVLLIIVLVVFGGKNNNLKDLMNLGKGQELKMKEQENEKKIQIVDVNSNSRNIAVMINNIKTVWGYQSGVQDAYIVYEIITEGGITRLMGIFKDANTSRIGTVRSSRAYYLDYALENDAIYVHIGGSPEALSDIRTLGVNDLDADATFRDKSLGLAYEHTAFASMEKINARIASRKYRTTTDKKLLLNYSIDEIDLSSMEGAIPANKVLISFSKSKNTSFVYDQESKRYKRFQNDIAHTDYVTKEQYTVKNIITYQVSNSTYDYKGRQTIDNIGSGTGYFISDGYAVPITWEKSSRKEQTVYKYLNGEEIKVNDGNTHIEIQPKNRTLEIN